MSKSIIQDTKECYITGAVSGLHKHHIFERNSRQKTIRTLWTLGMATL